MCLRALTSSYEGFNTEFLESLFFGCFESLRGENLETRVPTCWIRRVLVFE